MIYCISDIHGEYDKYMEMLEKINFSDEDSLFVIGDVVDRGAEPGRVLFDMSLRHNVYPLLGNHELMALDLLKTLMVEISSENADSHITAELLKNLALWQSEGGDTTLESFRRMSVDDRLAILDYLDEFEPYAVVDMPDGRRFVLVHAGLGNYSPDRALDDYSLAELTFARPMQDVIYYGGGDTFVFGHTPTVAINGKHEVLRTGNAIFIDCGATFGGRLACLCLDTEEVFYV